MWWLVMIGVGYIMRWWGKNVQATAAPTCPYCGSTTVQQGGQWGGICINCGHDFQWRHHDH